ncbi:hypothetical protein Cni_G28920 [Canna indica]|uniref:Uncharacterized protein n=1 Tax=Canna indica TaxID=4628 RepID=A0AAQ3L3N2_9LILI|nr:hypothetical protein Cni_G28920 [Canna indica]
MDSADQPPPPPPPPHDHNVELFHQVNSHIECETYEALKDILEVKNVGAGSVNFMDDSLLHVVIACRKSHLALKLIENISTNVVFKLGHKNYFGDTPLHIAATMNDVDVALALIGRKMDFINQRNEK